MARHDAVHAARAVAARRAPRSMQAAALLKGAQRPVIMFGRGSRDAQAWQPRIKLAERLGACVVTDLKHGAMFPTDHPAHYRAAVQRARQAGARAAVRSRRHPGARLGRSRRRAAAGEAGRQGVGQDHRATLDQNLHTGANMEYQSLPAVDVLMASTADVVVEDLLEALGPGRKEPWKVRVPAKPTRRERRRSPWSTSPRPCAPVQRSGERHLLHARPRLADRHLAVPERHVVSRQGRRRRARLRPRPLGRLGARAAERGRYAISMLGDGDFCMGATAIWTAVRHRIPLLVLINNNRSYFNDELHQDNGGEHARPRGEEPLDRAAHGRPGAQHRQARRGAGRGRHRPGDQRGRRQGGDRARASTCSRRAASA